MMNRKPDFWDWVADVIIASLLAALVMWGIGAIVKTETEKAFRIELDKHVARECLKD